MARSYGLNASGEKADIQRGDLVRFWPEDLVPNDQNYRFEAFDTDPEIVAQRERQIEDMVESLCRERQKQPIGIHEIPGQRYKVHAGDTRHKAFLRISERRCWPWGKTEDGGRPRVECVVENFPLQAEKEYFGASIVENLSRNSLSVISLCIAVAEATRLGYTDAEILTKFHQSDPAWLPNMRRLARLPDSRKREIHLKQLSASVGYVLAEIPEEFHDEVVAEASTESLIPARNPEQPVVEAPASRQPRKAKVTARAVVAAAKKRGLLKGKKVSHTIPGMREYLTPLKSERAGSSLLSRLSAAQLDWINTADNDAYYAATLAILKEVR